MTEGRPLHDLWDVETIATVVKTVMWLGFRSGIPEPVAKGAVGRIMAAQVPLTPLLDEETGERIGTLLEARPEVLLTLAHATLVDHLSTTAYPTDPSAW